MVKSFKSIFVLLGFTVGGFLLFFFLVFQFITGSIRCTKKQGVLAALHYLDGALDRYYLNHNVMPESLSELLETPADASDAYHAGVVKRSLLYDPWGAAYHYILIPGTKNTYVLFSFGSDSQPGGEGSKLDHFSLGSSGVR